MPTPSRWPISAWAPGSSLTLVLLLVFPEGRLLSRRWRPALWAALALIPLVFAGEAFLPQHMGGYLRNLPNPYAAACPNEINRA